MKPFAYDLHVHSCLSPCGDEDMTPANIAGMAALKGLDIVALADHNTAENCPAFLQACEAYGIVGVPGMELTCAEDVHLLCLFATLEEAMAFSDEVATRRIRIPNRPDIFGRQQVMDCEDRVLREEPDLLINATELDFYSAVSLVRAYGGVPIPAHVDKSANGAVAMLGAVPSDCGFACVEYFDPAAPDAPGAEGIRHISNSDAHFLWDIREGEGGCCLHLAGGEPDEIRRQLLAKLEGKA